MKLGDRIVYLGNYVLSILMKLILLGRKILPIKNISLFLLENPISQMSAERGSRRVFR